MAKIINGVNITQNNKVSLLYFTADSGKIVYRDKVDTLIGIKHPGIILGTDSFGTTWVIHNHYQVGHPQIETKKQFGAGARVFSDQRPVKYNREEIVNRAIDSWNKKEQYSWLKHNCQHFVSRVTTGKHESETLDRVADNLIGGGLLASAAAAANGKKGLAKAALVTAGIGGLIKLFSNK